MGVQSPGCQGVCGLRPAAYPPWGCFSVCRCWLWGAFRPTSSAVLRRVWEALNNTPKRQVLALEETGLYDGSFGWSRSCRLIELDFPPYSAGRYRCNRNIVLHTLKPSVLFAVLRWQDVKEEKTRNKSGNFLNISWAFGEECSARKTHYLTHFSLQPRDAHTIVPNLLRRKWRFNVVN